MSFFNDVYIRKHVQRINHLPEYPLSFGNNFEILNSVLLVQKCAQYLFETVCFLNYMYPCSEVFILKTQFVWRTCEDPEHSVGVREEC